MSLSPAISVPAVPASHKRLLLLKFGAIGDVVMAIPAAARMHAEGYAVDWVAGQTVAPVLELYPWIRVIRVDEAKLLRGSPGERLRAILALWKTLRAGDEGRSRTPYDLCATLYYDRRYRLLTLPVRARRRLSLSWRDRATRLLPGRHHTEEYARILSGRPDTETPSHLAPVPAPNLPPSSLPRLRGAARIVLVPGGARNLLRDDALRRWPVESYLALATILLRAGYEVVLAGGPEDGWASQAFLDAGVHVSERFTDLIGTLSLVQTLALLQSAEVIVTHDTGPLHLAGITSTAIVSLFGPTDPRGRLPQRANCVGLWGGESFACRPCYDGQNYAACLHNGCMREITPAMVYRQVQALLEARSTGREIPWQVLTPAPAGLVALAPNPAAEGVTQ